MSASKTTVRTAAASRYLVQLCKHWSHKFPETRFSDAEGRVPFGQDRACVFTADDQALHMRLEATDGEALDRLEKVVVEHLKRFAFREDLGDVRWSRFGETG